MNTKQITSPTDEQLENFRKGLSYSIGPYALILPVGELRVLHAKMQNSINVMAEDIENETKKPVEKIIEEPKKKEPLFDSKNNWFQKALKLSKR